jgi:hypothetical protein
MLFFLLPTDPPTWSDYITLVGYAGALFAAWWALNELERNRSEKVESRQIELAEDTLAKFYEAEEIFRAVSSPFGYLGEGSTRTKDGIKNLDVNTNKKIDAAYSTIERLKKIDEFFISFSAICPRVEALIGKETHDEFVEVLRVRKELILMSEFMMEEAETPSADPSEIREWRRVRYGSFTEKDPVHMKLEAVKSKLERKLLPMMSSRLSKR